MGVTDRRPDLSVLKKLCLKIGRAGIVSELGWGSGECCRDIFVCSSRKN